MKGKYGQNCCIYGQNNTLALFKNWLVVVTFSRLPNYNPVRFKSHSKVYGDLIIVLCNYFY